MPAQAQSVQKVIVIPQQLEDYFLERLSRVYAGREDVRVVVDRRVGERRRPRWVSGSGPFSERRHGDRREAD
ncbi:MAG: hypothetical protein WCN81_11305, partial [Actinomycetes bacterium]